MPSRVHRPSRSTRVCRSQYQLPLSHLHRKIEPAVALRTLRVYNTVEKVQSHDHITTRQDSAKCQHASWQSRRRGILIFHCKNPTIYKAALHPRRVAQPLLQLLCGKRRGDGSIEAAMLGPEAWGANRREEAVRTLWHCYHLSTRAGRAILHVPRADQALMAG